MRMPITSTLDLCVGFESSTNIDLNSDKFCIRNLNIAYIKVSESLAYC